MCMQAALIFHVVKCDSNVSKTCLMCGIHLLDVGKMDAWVARCVTKASLLTSILKHIVSLYKLYHEGP